MDPFSGMKKVISLRPTEKELSVKELEMFKEKEKKTKKECLSRKKTALDHKRARLITLTLQKLDYSCTCHSGLPVPGRLGIRNPSEFSEGFLIPKHRAQARFARLKRLLLVQE
jgi:hypothetical protein